MNALKSPTSSGIGFDGYGLRGSSSSPALQVCFLRPQIKAGSFGFLNLIAGKESKLLIRPFTCLSSDTDTQVDLGTEEAQIEEIYQSKAAHVKFQLQRECFFGEHFYIVGDDPMLGSWDPESAIPLNWSDGHLWGVELDVPVGRSIQFKFILKSRSGSILWQPGPNRILKTWETQNLILVYEDWENAEDHKVMEEDQAASGHEDSTYNSEMKIVGEDLSQQEAKMLSNVMKSDLDANSAQRSSSEIHQMKLTADDFASVNTSTELSEKNSGTSMNSAAIHKKDTMVAKNILRNNVILETVYNSGTEDVMSNLIDNGGGLVLVPGLPPVMPTEEAKEDKVENMIALEGSNGSFEATDHNLPEILLEEKQEAHNEIEPPQEERTEEMFNDMDEDLGNDFHQKPCFAKTEEQPDFKLVPNKVLQNDIQWGCKTLLKFLTSFGLL